MIFDLTDEQQSLRRSILELAARELNGGASARDRHGAAHDRTLWRHAGRVGLLGLVVPPEHGGSGLDAISAAVALEALGYGCTDGGLSFAFGAHALSCVVPIYRYGSAEQRARYLPRLCDGTLIAANAVTEPDAGSDAYSAKLRAVPDGDRFRLEGTKTLITSAPVADLIVVFAVTDPHKGFLGGITAFLVESGAPGLSAPAPFETLGLRAAALGQLHFDGVSVGTADALGGIGGGSRVFAEAMDWERALLSAIHVGAMERLLAGALDHARTRAQFGQPIGKFQAVSHRLADLRVRIDSSRLLVQRAAATLDAGRSATLEASMAKLASSEALVETALTALQVHGGSGYLTGPVERHLRDALASTIYSGTSEIQRNIIARWLGL